MNIEEEKKRLPEMPFLPKVGKRVISVNPESNSIALDQLIFDLYRKSLRKNESLATYNELKRFIRETAQDREEALQQVIHEEKWFKKGIEFIKEYRPYRENQEKDEEKVEQLYSSYPTISFEDFLEDYGDYEYFRLSSLLEYIDNNWEYIQQVTSTKLARDAKQLKEAILHFDKVHLLHERTKDLQELMLANGLDNPIEEDRFVRTKEQVNQDKKRLGDQGGNKDQGGRPEHVSDEYIYKFIKEWIEKARQGDPEYKSLIWDTPKKKGQVHFAQVAQRLITSSEVEKIDKDTYLRKSTLDDKVSAIVKEKAL